MSSMRIVLFLSLFLLAGTGIHSAWSITVPRACSPAGASLSGPASTVPIHPKGSTKQNRSTIRQWLKQQKRFAKKSNSGRIVLAVLVSLALLFLILTGVHLLATYIASPGLAVIYGILGLAATIFLFTLMVRKRKKTG